jgi:Zn ribbon nucleic-acid-binding protein
MDCCGNCECGKDGKGEKKKSKYKEKEIKIYFCPRCRSNNVRFIFGVGNIFGIIPKQKCFKCGFEMHNFPILVTTKTRLEEASQKKRKIKSKLKKSGRKK